MNEITFPTQSNATIVKASVIALLVSTVLFVTLILPVEYNIDLTGTGKLLGLTALAEKSSNNLTKENSKTQPSDLQENTATVVIPPGKGVEYKFKMNKYSNLTYQWNANGTPLFFDFHGEPKGDKTGYFKSYTIATASKVKGSMTAPFDGVHGWYWKNNSSQQVTVTLYTQGDYEIIGLIH